MLENSERRPTRDLILRLANALKLTEREADELLAAGGSLPTAYDRVSPADPDLLMIARILGDPSLEPAHRTQFRALLRLAILGWRSDLGDVVVTGAGPTGTLEASPKRLPDGTAY